jgi:hypothetical protein
MAAEEPLVVVGSPAANNKVAPLMRVKRCSSDFKGLKNGMIFETGLE